MKRKSIKNKKISRKFDGVAYNNSTISEINKIKDEFMKFTNDVFDLNYYTNFFNGFENFEVNEKQKKILEYMNTMKEKKIEKEKNKNIELEQKIKESSSNILNNEIKMNKESVENFKEYKPVSSEDNEETAKYIDNLENISRLSEKELKMREKGKNRKEKFKQYYVKPTESVKDVNIESVKDNVDEYKNIITPKPPLLSPEKTIEQNNKIILEKKEEKYKLLETNPNDKKIKEINDNISELENINKKIEETLINKYSEELRKDYKLKNLNLPINKKSSQSERKEKKIDSEKDKEDKEIIEKKIKDDFEKEIANLKNMDTENLKKEISRLINENTELKNFPDKNYAQNIIKQNNKIIYNIANIIKFKLNKKIRRRLLTINNILTSKDQSDVFKNFIKHEKNKIDKMINKKDLENLRNDLNKFIEKYKNTNDEVLKNSVKIREVLVRYINDKIEENEEKKFIDPFFNDDESL